MTTRRPAVNPKKLRPYDQPPRRRRALIPSGPDSAATGFFVAAALWMALAAGIGVLAVGIQIIPIDVSYALGIFNLAIEVDAMRIEYAFVNATVYGWLSNAAFAALCFMTPRLTGRRLALEVPLMLALPIWNFSLLGGIASLFFVDPRPHSALTAMFWFFDGGLAFAAFVVTAAFLVTAAPTILRGYVSSWFAGVSLLALMGLIGLDALVGLLTIWFSLPEIAIALGSAYVDRAIWVMWLLGMTLAILHYVVPRGVGLPLASWGVALLTFLTWLAVAPLVGIGELTDATIPYAITTIGSVATMLLLVPVTLTVANLAASMQGRWSLLFGAGTASLALLSMAFLLGSALMAAIGALRSVSTFLSGTDWELGLVTWTAYGAFTFAAFAAADHGMPRILRRAWQTNAIGGAQLWLAFAGATLAGVALFGGGLAEASLAVAGAPAEEQAAALLPYRLGALAGLGLLALAGLAFLLNLFLLYTTAEPEEYAVPGQAAPVAAH